MNTLFRFLPAIMAFTSGLLFVPVYATDDGTSVAPPQSGGAILTSDLGKNTLTTIMTQSNLTGDWGGERTKLMDKGFTITPSWTQEVFGNPTGGFKQGVVESGLLSLALDADMAKLTGWSGGGALHANCFYLYGPNLDAQDVGDITTISNITGYNTFRMQELWYQQPFWQQKASLKLGLIAIDTEFFTSNTSALFINSTFGAFSFISLNDPFNAPIYPIASPGVRLNIKPSDDFYVQAGVFEGNNGSQTQNKNGFDFRFNGASGVLIMSEAGYLLNQGANDKGLAGTYKVGAFVHTGQFDSWDSQTQNALNSSPLVERTPDYGIYGIIDQQVYKTDSQCISAFLRGGYAPSQMNVVEPYLDGGVNLTGIVPGRDKDVFCFAASRTWISGAFDQFNQAINGAAHSTEETVVEATYRAQITPWWTLQPDIQYIIQPGATTIAHNALILGARSSIQF
jgi:porin